MKIARMAMVSVLVGGALVSSCGKKGSPAPNTSTSAPSTPAEMKDSEVRTFLEGDLKLYLDSLAYQVCIIKRRVDATMPGREICPPGPPDGYRPPPTNGKP